MPVALSVSVDRTGLGLGALELNDMTSYFVWTGGFEPGGVSMRREVAESRFVPGRVLVGQVPDVVTSRLGVYAMGGTTTVVEARMSVAIRALTQLAYEMTITRDGAQTVWACEAADWELGAANGALTRGLTAALILPITFTIPRSPIVTAGIGA